VVPISSFQSYRYLFSTLHSPPKLASFWCRSTRQEASQMFHSNASPDYKDRSSTHASINDTRNNSICRLIPFMGHHDVTRVKMACLVCVCVVGVVVVVAPKCFRRRTSDIPVFWNIPGKISFPLVEGAACRHCSHRYFPHASMNNTVVLTCKTNIDNRIIPAQWWHCSYGFI
jgi:hypothetical protein